MGTKHKSHKEWLRPTEYLINMELRRLEKQDTCPHGDISYFADGIYTCICGKAFTEIELDELEWDLEDSATETKDQ